MTEHISEQDRFPLAKEAGWRMLNRLRQHPHAPSYTYHCGEKLSVDALRQVRGFANRLTKSPSRWTADSLPDWLPEYVRRCQQDVPFYRDRDSCEDGHQTDFESLPCTTREDIRRAPWNFVPDSADLADLIVYSTSGTTGNLLKVICEPSVPARYLPLIEYAVAEHGVRLEGGDRVTIVQVAAQESTYTLASVMSYFNFAGFAKVNLHPSQWSSVGDCESFLDDCNAELYTGDPFALVELSKRKIRTRPKAIISSATALLPAVKAHLQQRFGCPVIDMISMNESGPIAFTVDRRHRIFPHQVYVEIVDGSGHQMPSGSLGEIVISGGINPMLPLLRYRTGDFGALEFEHEQPYLTQFNGRTPVFFFRSDGSVVRSIDVIVALYGVPLPVFRLHQACDGRLRFQTRCDDAHQRQAEECLLSLFGADQSMVVEQIPTDSLWQGKAIQFTSDMNQPIE